MFQSARSILNLYDPLERILREAAAEEEKKEVAREKKKAKASARLSEGSERKAQGNDQDNDVQHNEEKGEDQQQDKAGKDEKAARLLKALSDNKFMLHFLSDFGGPYTTVVKFFQETKKPWAHEAYYQILEFQQSIFNAALKFISAEANQVDEQEGEANDGGLPGKDSEVRKGARARKGKNKLWCTCNSPVNNSPMVSCSSYGMCASDSPKDDDSCQWFHFSCVGLTEKKAEELEQEGIAWFCPRCVAKRGPRAQPQKGDVNWVRRTSTTAALQLVGLSADALDALPTTDVVAQHWDPSFRAAIRDNNYIAAKTVQEVTWDGFPMTKKYFGESKESADVKETKAEQLIQFCFNFFQNFNVRMAEQKDIETMEACTVFDPRPKRKAKNKNSYLSKISVLLAAFGSGLSKNVVQITNGAAQWFCSPQYNENDDEDVEVLECFRKLHLSSNPDVAAFASWGLNVLKNLLATALVENFFSTVTQLKTKYRGKLEGDGVQVAVVMRTEPDFKDVAFDAYYNEFREFSKL